MKLETEFIKLPLRFDADQLAEEISVFSEVDWRKHPSNYKGNRAIPLVSAGGKDNDDLRGVMLPTLQLQRCPYIQQVLASFNTVIGRCRLMKLEPYHSVPRHYDSNYYWFNRIRVHIPILTDPGVRFVCNNQSVHMAPGEAWVFDNWQMHEVIHQSDRPRVHLVFDTCGTGDFWRVVEEARTSTQVNGKSAYFVRYEPTRSTQLRLERAKLPPVMPPGDVDIALQDIIDDLDPDSASEDISTPFVQLLQAHRRNWRSLWTVYGASKEGWSHYRSLNQHTLGETQTLGKGLKLASNKSAAAVAVTMRISASLNLPESFDPHARIAPQTSSPRRRVRFHQPVFIVAAPRSGSTLLFETLTQSRSLWTVGGESHRQFETISALRPANRGFSSNCLTAADATPDVVRQLLTNIALSLHNADGVSLSQIDSPPEAIRLLEKTPKNSLRIPFLKQVFPGARFIFLHRSPEANISSIMSAWRSGRFVTYRTLPDWQGLPWSLVLPPNWQQVNGAPLAEIAALQWASTNQTILKTLLQMPSDRWCAVSYERFLDNPSCTIQRLCKFASIPFDRHLQSRTANSLPHSRYTLTAPASDKWKQHADELAPVLPGLQELAEELRSLVPVTVG